MPKSNRRNSHDNIDKLVQEDDASLEALKARVGAAVNIFTLVFVVIAILAPSSVYIYELLYSEDPPTVWWLEVSDNLELKDLTIHSSNNELDTASEINVVSSGEWVRKYQRMSRRWSEGTFCSSERSLARHSGSDGTNTKHRKSSTAQSNGFIFDATYTDYRAYVSILLKDNTQSLCETRAAVNDHPTSSSTSSSAYSESLYANRTWLHVPKVYPKAFYCRFYDHKSKLLASSSSQSLIAGYYVRCPVPPAVRHRHKLLMRLQWFEEIQDSESRTGKHQQHMRGRNQTGTFRREPKQATHFSHLFPVCTHISTEYHSGYGSTSSTQNTNSAQSSGSSDVATVSVATDGSTRAHLNISTFSALGLLSALRNHSRGGHPADSDIDLVTQYNMSVCGGVGQGSTGYTSWDRLQLIEWLEYHRVLGVEHFFLYDFARSSTSPSSVAAKKASVSPSSTEAFDPIADKEPSLSLREILAPFVSAGVVTLIPWLEPSCQSARAVRAGASEDSEDVCVQSRDEYHSTVTTADEESFRREYESVFVREFERYHTAASTAETKDGKTSSGHAGQGSQKDAISRDPSPVSSDRRRQRAEQQHIRAMQSCYLRHRESSHWMAFLSPNEFVGVNSHRRMKDGTKLHSLPELLMDDEEENPHTVAVKLPTAPYFPCTQPGETAADAEGLQKSASAEGDSSSSAADQFRQSKPLRIDSHVFTIPATTHSHSGGRQRKYATARVASRIAIVRTDSVLFWSPHDDKHLFAYLSNRKITPTRVAADGNSTEPMNGKKRNRKNSGSTDNIEGLMGYSLRLTHLEPHSESYTHVVRRIEPDVSQLMSFRSSIEVSQCQEERETVKLADIIKTSSLSTSASASQISNSSAATGAASVESLMRRVVTAVWDEQVCRIKGVAAQTQYALPERSRLVTERVAAVLSGTVPAPFVHDHANDRL